MAVRRSRRLEERRDVARQVAVPVPRAAEANHRRSAGLVDPAIQLEAGQRHTKMISTFFTARFLNSKRAISLLYRSVGSMPPSCVL
jgi:hypothetical protein